MVIAGMETLSRLLLIFPLCIGNLVKRIQKRAALLLGVISAHCAVSSFSVGGVRCRIFGCWVFEVADEFLNSRHINCGDFKENQILYMVTGSLVFNVSGYLHLCF
jgi:hypothetical protein